MQARAMILLVLGALMVGLGAYIAGRLLATGGALTGSKLFDALFAFFFILRGAMNIVAARRAGRAGA